ncbi:peptidylprolyl isomerase [Ilumatobacter sp.]|uniref:peptidylprolyl isomerase n=1 Tax=Ilumatobacter sp. TaxID=1967498 RepID=UPI003B51CD78
MAPDVRSPGRRVALALAAAALVASCGSDGGEGGAVAPAGSGGSEEVTCPPAEGTDEATLTFAEPPPPCLEPGATYTATITTNIGELTIDLDAEAAPETVNSFVFLARNAYFDGTICHRVIQDFVVQCGDPTGTGTGGPGYTIPDEFPEAGAYRVGSVAMAKRTEPNTGGSQFFIISGEQGAALPPLYSLFGQVASEDLGVVEDANALGSTDGAGVPSEEIRIEDVEITQT